jgi:glucose-1-phosphate thymidylyltransferase
MDEVDRAVILARGLGKRMRVDDASAQLPPDQATAADAGIKAMIPVGRPFLDYVLSALADAGIRSICLVVGPEHTSVRDYYRSLDPRRIHIAFAIQTKALGTANALLAARSFVGREPFLVLNSDNYYPVEVFRRLCELGEPGLAAFERESLIRDGNIPRERIRDYALLRIDRAGYLEGIVEKPALVPDARREVFVSMNCWRFDDAIFHACEQVPQSARGEFELPQAVQLGITSFGLRFKAVPFGTGVLDLSYRADIPAIAQRLANTRPDL